MRNQKGFTLLEIMIVCMLSGILFASGGPVIIKSWQVIAKNRQQEEAEMLGDHMFHSVSGQLQNASAVFLGDEKELRDISGDRTIENWKNIRLQMPVDTYTALIELEAVEDDWINLHVKLNLDETTLYERTEAFSILNLALYKKRRIEGNDNIAVLIEGNRETESEIWYLPLDTGI